jgi:hypothetical protein
MRIPPPIFIIGTGRSGTHWLAETLKADDGLFVDIEVQPRFRWSTAMALDPGRESSLFWKLCWNYRFSQWVRPHKRMVDKSHPNLWFAEKLLHAFPQANFLGIRRGVCATVASMLRCPPVMDWHRRWREFPIPNRFLGIGMETADRYDELSPAEQCTLRWLAHRDRLQCLEPLLGERLLVVDYESMMDDTESTLADIARFIGLSKPLEIPPIRSESRSKWRQVLSDEDVRDIDHLVEAFPPGSLLSSLGLTGAVG